MVCLFDRDSLVKTLIYPIGDECKLLGFRYDAEAYIDDEHVHSASNAW